MLPSSKSYKSVCAGIEDLFLEAKLKFFCYIAGMIEPYLIKYQTNKPMAPYMYADLRRMLRKLMGIVPSFAEDY